jgi:hypothetical protein
MTRSSILAAVPVIDRRPQITARSESDHRSRVACHRHGRSDRRTIALTRRPVGNALVVDPRNLVSELNQNGDGRSGARRQLAGHRHALMPLSVFHDREQVPTDDAVRRILGGAHAAWDQLLGLVTERIGAVSEVWRCTNARTGWGLRLLREDRVILYMTPQPRQFIVSFALGERAVEAARVTTLSAPVLQAIDAAPRFAEGRGVRITVRDGRDIQTITRLAQIKCELSR